VKVRRFVAVDDCGNIINPMIVEGQIHGGLTMGLAPALYEEINYDADGNIQGGSLMDYLVPTSMETPNWETGKTCTPSPHHPLGAKGVGESATVGAPPRNRQCRRRRALAPRRAPHRHSDHAAESVEDPAGEGCGGVGIRDDSPQRHRGHRDISVLSVSLW
jgi:Aerobic-type carbon monoxide dehydrogenase, large subunit CoxL/CutL homologs